jgi:twitching motility protein PilT
MTELNELLEHLIEQRGSDLHIKAGSIPHLRVQGRLQRTAYRPTTSEELEAVVAELLPVSRSQELAELGEISIAYGVSGLGRFRVNVYRQRGSYGMSIRWVSPGAPAIGALNLPPVVEKLASEESSVAPRAASASTNTSAARVSTAASTTAARAASSAAGTEKIGVW